MRKGPPIDILRNNNGGFVGSEQVSAYNNPKRKTKMVRTALKKVEYGSPSVLGS